MAISTTSNETSYTGSGTTGPFSYPWRIDSTSELSLRTTVTATGVETALTNGVDYTIDPVYVGRAGGGFLTLASSIASTSKLFIRRILVVDQPTNYRNQAHVSPQDVEDSLDLRAKIDQQQQSQIDRRLAFPETETVSAAIRTAPPAVDRRNKLLGFADTSAAELTVYARGAASGSGSIVVEAGDGIDVTSGESEGVTTYTVALFTAFVATLSGGADHEVGSSVATVSLVWSYNKTIASQTLAGTGTTTPLTADRAQTATGPYTTNVTFTVTGDTGSETDDATTSVLFKSKRYWGVSANATLTDGQIIALAGSELATALAQTRSLSPSAQYMYFAFPASFGTPTFTVNGLLNTAWSKVRSASAFVNASGATVSYDVWRSDNLLTSTYSVVLS